MVGRLPGSTFKHAVTRDDSSRLTVLGKGA